MAVPMAHRPCPGRSSPTGTWYDQEVTVGGGSTVPLRRNAPFQLLWWGRAVGGIGNALAFLAFPLLAQQTLGGSHAAGLTLVADQLGELTTLLVAGVVADRVDRGRLLIAATALQLVAVGSVVALLATRHLTLPAMLVSVFAAGVAWSLYGTAETAAVAQVVPPTQRAEAAGLNQTRGFVVGLVAAPLGGVLFAFHHQLPFVLDIALGLVLVVALLMVRGRLRVGRGTDHLPRGVVAQAREGFSILLRDPVQRRILLALAVINAVDPLLVLALVAISVRAGHGGTGTGLIYGAGIALGLAGSFVTPRLLRGARPGVAAIAAIWLIGLCLAGMAATTGRLWAAGACYALTFLAIPVLAAVFVGYRVARTPQRLQGRSAAATGLIVLGFRPVVSLVAGFALGASVAGSVAVGAAVVGLLALLLTLTRNIRRMPPAADWAVES